MKISRKYAAAVVLLAVLAVAFGVFGTVAPPLAEETAPVQPAQESSSESVGHFTYPPTYDSGWVDIRDKCGQYFSLKHDLNTTDVVVDIAGKQSLDPMSGTSAWSKTYGGTDSDSAYSVILTVDGGYALAGNTASFGAGSYDFWLVKTDSAGTMQWSQAYGGALTDDAESLVQTVDGGYALAGNTASFGAGSYDFWLVKTDSAGTVQWNRTYGGADSDLAYSLVQTADGGYALAGYSYSFGASSDLWLVKTDSAGTMLWNKTYGGASADFARSLVQTVDGGYGLAGYTNSFGAGVWDFWLVKTDSAGTMLWNKTYGGASTDRAWSLVQTVDGGYGLAGYTNSFGASSDLWLVKTDSAGTMLWNKTYGGASADFAWSLVQTVDGGYALVGATYSFGAGGNDFWLVKTDSAGTVQWNRTYGGANTESAYSLVQTTDNGYALAGYTDSFGAGGDDFWLVRVKPEMNLEHQRYLGGTNLIYGWSRTYGGTGNDVAYSVVQTGDGGYAIAGSIYSGVPYGDFWLVKTDALGIVLWNKTYGGTGTDVANSMAQTSDGGYVLAGGTYSFGAGYSDFWLVKTDSDGNMQWNKTYGGTYNDYAYSVVQTGDGGYALAGSTESFGDGDDYDFWLVKTDVSGNAQWSRRYGRPGSPPVADDVARSVVQTGDGGYALAGSTHSGLEYTDSWLVKTDASGIALWDKTYGGIGGESACSLVQTSDGGYVLAGNTHSDRFSDSDFWLVKTDSTGAMLWNRTYGGTSDEVAWSLVQTVDGGYALAGYTDSFGAGDEDFWLVKTDSDGTMKWSQTYGGKSDDMGWSLVQTADGGYALAGYTRSSGAGNADLWLIKTDVESGLAWTGLTSNSMTLYRGKTDLYWNYVRVRIWLIKEPSWIYGDINMDGIVDAKDLYIIGKNYGKTFSLLSLSGIAAVAGIRTVKKRKQPKQPSYIS